MKTNKNKSWMRSIYRMGLKAAIAALIIATPAFADPSGETLEAIVPGAGESPGDTPDYTRLLSPLALDLESGFENWKMTSESVNIVYGDWYTTGGGGGFLCGGGGGSTTVVNWRSTRKIKSPGFKVESIGSGASVIKLQSIKPFIPFNTPKVHNKVVPSELVSPLIDLSFNKYDKLRFEYSVGSGFSLLVMLSTDAGENWNVIKTIRPNGNTKFRKININLERHGALRFKQTRKAQLKFVVMDSSSRVIGSEGSGLMLRNIVTPPLYQESFEPLKKSEALHIVRESDSLVTLRWDHGVLESAPTPSGPWSRVENASSPHPLLPTLDMDFFRLRARVEGD
tara:strand:+ start:314 stop:1330 length:1017 start_codon:yes stop_codon:yes gene_type:complete